MYHIKGLPHRTSIEMGVHGFTIDLSPQWKEMVAACENLNPTNGQNAINYLIRNAGEGWLTRAGYKRPLYGHRDILIQWGEWGPHHIIIPGNACGLDISDDSFGCIFSMGRSLRPHNIDSLHQKYLFLMIFTEIAESVIYKI